MSQTHKAEYIKARSLTEVFSVKDADNKIIAYTPREYAFAPIKPRIVRGKYGVRLQIAQYKLANGWSQISLTVENIDLLTQAIFGLISLMANAVSLGYINPPSLETLQKAASELELSARTLRKLIEDIEKKKSSNSK